MLLSEIMNALHLVLGRQLIMMIYQPVRDMKGAQAVRIWTSADQVILLAARLHRMINHLLGELQDVEVRNHRLDAQQIGTPIMNEMAEIIMLTAHLLILTEIEGVLVRRDVELPHLLGIEEVGTRLEGMKVL